MKQTPPGKLLVSCIITTHNRFEHLQAAIQSVLDQDYWPIEIIVVNDGSTDTRYHDFRHPQVQIHHLSPSSRELFGYPSPGYARNRGAELAKGAYLAFLDDDDYWYPKKISEQMKLIQEKSLDICHTDADIGTGVYSPSSLKVPFFSTKTKNAFPSYFNLETIKDVNYIIFSSVLVSKNLFEKAGAFPETALRGSPEDTGVESEDYVFLKKCLAQSKSGFLDEALLYYDGHFNPLQLIWKKILQFVEYCILK